jgi:hypothetical protein
MTYITAAIAFCPEMMTLSSTVEGAVKPDELTLSFRMSKATTAMTPTTAPQMPSKKAARNWRNTKTLDGCSLTWIAMTNTNFVTNDFLEEVMTRDREHEAWEEHAQSDDRGTGECRLESAVDMSALKAHECSENHQRCRYHVTDGDTIDEDLRGKPSAEEDCLSTDERDCGESTTERDRSGNQTENEEVDEIGGTGDTEGQSYRGRDSFEGDVDSICDILKNENNQRWNVVAACEKHIDKAAYSEGKKPGRWGSDSNGIRVCDKRTS